MKKLYFIISILSISIISCFAGENPVLKIEGGKIQGIPTKTPGVYVFKGIPYAAPPIGELRWKSPQPVIPWQGIKVADVYGPAPMQTPRQTESFYYKEFFTDDGHKNSEDCLYLNIYTTSPGKRKAGLPVAMNIYGGAFASGYAYGKQFLGGEEWAKHGVILVTINYRLNVFGFLAHPELSSENPKGVSGNYGILDQIAALKWVKNNIQQFGGDPKNITIFGQSAGAMSVQALVTSTLSKDLMQKAIMQSGGGVSDKSLLGGTQLKDAEKAGKAIMDLGGFKNLEAMRVAPADSILALTSLARKKRIGGMMGPVIDGYVLSSNFSEAARNNQIADIPYIIGYNKDDMGGMTTGLGQFCKLRDEKGGKAYAYEFVRALPGDTAKAFHSAELWYVFHTLESCWRPFTEGDKVLSDYMVDTWTNFVKFGDPNGKDKEIWRPYTKENQQFMIFKLADSGEAQPAMGLPTHPQ
ncbi:MAG: carboxylesterase family protein [Prolixibacteraceae bacterium]